MLRLLHAITTPTGRIVLDSVDPYEGADAADLAYQERNRARGRAPGEVTIRLRYRGLVTPWYELLNVSARELKELASGAGWTVADLVDGDPGEYYAVLEKAGESS